MKIPNKERLTANSFMQSSYNSRHIHVDPTVMLYAICIAILH